MPVDWLANTNNYNISIDIEGTFARIKLRIKLLTMKKLLTTCYGRISKLPKGTKLVRTSVTAPDFLSRMNHMFVPEFAPIHFKTTDWREQYSKQLDRLLKTGRLHKIMETIPDGAVLLCFEGDHNDCHRKILGDFIRYHGLAEVTEFEAIPAKPTTTALPQMSLL